MIDATHGSASDEEDAESRAYRRIADALERDEFDELAVALGQVPIRRGTRRTPMAVK